MFPIVLGVIAVVAYAIVFIGMYSDTRRNETNGDRIRKMDNVELADWLVMNGDGSDFNTWYDWLNKKVRDNDETARYY